MTSFTLGTPNKQKLQPIKISISGKLQLKLTYEQKCRNMCLLLK